MTEKIIAYGGTLPKPYVNIPILWLREDLVKIDLVKLWEKAQEEYKKVFEGD